MTDRPMTDLLTDLPTDLPRDRPTMTDEAILAIAMLMFFVAPALLMGAAAIVAYIDYIRQAPR
jgi:hypothetical protein